MRHCRENAIANTCNAAAKGIRRIPHVTGMFKNAAILFQPFNGSLSIFGVFIRRSRKSPSSVIRIIDTEDIDDNYARTYFLPLRRWLNGVLNCDAPIPH